MTIPLYHIFAGPDEDAVWVEAVDGLGSAHERMEKLAAAVPGPYFIYSSKTYGIVATIDTSRTRDS